ncbi:hypothetical protein B0H16DRAFT_1891231 [Mycena metata]|uniref:Uncharacterized protein n=1 Tax=Mycena metata TaxID=1033252 RepID=A0AAD7ICJ7_9AGAR|nr:hypothetical protein B0H16DRAFT_1891231 [Mycena metata]
MTANELPTLRKIWTFQFTHLETVSLIMTYRSELSLESVVPLQQLLSVPTLRRLILHCDFSDGDLSARLWDRCSPALREIALHCDQRQSKAALPLDLSPSSHPGRTIPLESLYLGSTETLDYRLMRTPSLFDLSHLRILCIGWRAHIPWSDFSPLVRNIQVLSIVVNAHATGIDLASFPNLTSLRVFLPPWFTTTARLAMATQLFSGVAPVNVIRSIVVATEPTTLDGHVCTTLDTLLSALPVLPPPKVEFEVTADEYEGIWPYFVRLNSTNSLGRVQDLADNWWDWTQQDSTLAYYGSLPTSTLSILDLYMRDL